MVRTEGGPHGYVCAEVLSSGQIVLLPAVGKNPKEQARVDGCSVFLSFPSIILADSCLRRSALPLCVFFQSLYLALRSAVLTDCLAFCSEPKGGSIRSGLSKGDGSCSRSFFPDPSKVAVEFHGNSNRP